MFPCSTHRLVSPTHKLDDDSSNNRTKDGARIKAWPGALAALSTDLQGGGGSGLVKNITFDGMTIDNVDYAIEVTQCYGQRNLTLCNETPVRVHPSFIVPLSLVFGCQTLTNTYATQSKLVMEDIYFRNFKGVTSGKGEPYVGKIVCSSPDVSARTPQITYNSSTDHLQVCSNINASNIDVVSPDGGDQFTCANVGSS